MDVIAKLANVEVFESNRVTKNAFVPFILTSWAKDNTGYDGAWMVATTFPEGVSQVQSIGLSVPPGDSLADWSAIVSDEGFKEDLFVGARGHFENAVFTAGLEDAEARFWAEGHTFERRDVNLAEFLGRRLLNHFDLLKPLYVDYEDKTPLGELSDMISTLLKSVGSWKKGEKRRGY